MQRRLTALITFFFITLIFVGCSTVTDKNWTALIPDDASFVVIPEENLTLGSIPSKKYASLLDDLTPAAIQQVAAFDSVVSSQLSIRALVLYPTTATHSNLVWITENPNADIEQWAYRFYQPFAQNNYWFHDVKVHKLFFNNDDIFAAQAGQWLVFSESSLALENAIRAYTSDKGSLDTEIEMQTGSETLVINTPQLDRWIEQFGSVTYRPSLTNAFAGSGPVSFNYSGQADSLGNNISLNGVMPLIGDTASVLVDALTFSNRPVTLDRHIASNAAAFAIFRLPPVSIPVQPTEQPTRLDSLLMADLDLYQQLAGRMNEEFAFEAFPESGLSANGEHLFLRRVNNPAGIREVLDQLAEEGFIQKSGEVYQASSSVLSVLIGSGLSTFRDYYLAFSGNVLVMAKRKGLAESVSADRNRRRVIYYDETYSSVRSSLPSSISGFVWADAGELLQFLKPFLKTENVAGGLLNRFDITSLVATREDENANISINTYTRRGSSSPYDELWVMPLDDNTLSGQPALGDLVGSTADEVVFSTREGQVMALAADGTIVMQASTGGLSPVGSPVLYDWYGSGQPIILLAAGSKIFAWNENGSLLPSFPIELNEQISAPLLVTDILRNGVPELVVATQNRKVHVLNGRGENVDGWPQNTNAIVDNTPVFEMVDDVWTLWAFSQNTLHGWMRDGTSRPGFPQFINARFSGSPVVYRNQILGSAADGYLYSIGENPIFADSLAMYLSQEDISVKSLYVANNELTATKIERDILLKDSTEFIREDVILTQSQNGSVFLYNTDGALRFTQSMGQPSSSTYIPSIEDLNSDDNREVVALADFGRMYAWEVLTGERLYGLPTSGMRYPLITDLNRDGQKELIAQTREGLRCWTINRGE